MKKFLNAVSKILAFLCAGLFVLAAAIALVFFNVEKRLFNAQFYLRALESQGFYERLPAIAAETLAATDGTGGPPDSLKSLSKENWEKVIAALLPPELLRALTEDALTSIFAYLDGKTDSAALSLVELKARIGGPAGTQAVTEMLRAQPSCTLAQTIEMAGSALSGNPTLVFCNPGEDALALAQPIIQSTLQTASAGIPDSATLIHPDDPNLQNPLRAVRALRAILRLSPLAPLGLLFLVTLFAVRDAKSWLRWWGIPILIAGLIGLVTALAAGPIADWGFAKFLLPRLPAGLPNSMMEIMRGLESAALAGIARPIAIQSAVLAFGGIAMVAATRLVKKSDTPQAPAV